MIRTLFAYLASRALVAVEDVRWALTRRRLARRAREAESKELRAFVRRYGDQWRP